ncbi:MAG: 30S ribosomal protein S13 [Nanoarchaeota archaeon]|nr:30S ribosomal protein S13 [Nanoarchaeota archaeon]
MAEEKIEEKKKKGFGQKKPEVHREEQLTEALIRIQGTDISGNASVYPGLTRIKGISFALSNAVCLSLGIDKKKKVSDLNEKEMSAISEFIKNPKVPEWMLNRRKDTETGESKHLLTNDLDYSRESDIRAMKKMKSYRGWRHATGQPVRGQRTKSHFRHGSSVGVAKSKEAKAQTAAKSDKKK